MSIYRYKKYIFLGGGVMARRLKKQFDEHGMELVGVMDLFDDEERTIKSFEGIEIHTPDYYNDAINSKDVAIVVAIGSINVIDIVNNYACKYANNLDRLYVVNPYTTLRFSCINDSFANEIRIPVSDKRYDEVRNMFNDEVSNKIYTLLVTSASYDSINDPYEVIPYLSIRDMYWYSEDYWDTYDFEGYNDNERATVIDCGAYIGDSVLPICEAIPYSDVLYYAFEPLDENANLIESNEELRKACSKLRVLRFGCGEKDSTLVFKLPDNGDKEGGRFVEEEFLEGKECEKLQIRRIDGLKLDIQGQLFIKMDVEGSELSALKGCEMMIKKHRPYLAICLYHKKNDLIDIPLYIKSVCPNYSFFLRGGAHTIMWAIPN